MFAICSLVLAGNRSLSDLQVKSPLSCLLYADVSNTSLSWSSLNDILQAPKFAVCLWQARRSSQSVSIFFLFCFFHRLLRLLINDCSSSLPDEITLRVGDLPALKYLAMRNASRLRSLQLSTAPRLQRVDLRGCTSLECLTLPSSGGGE